MLLMLTSLSIEGLFRKLPCIFLFDKRLWVFTKEIWLENKKSKKKSPVLLIRIQVGVVVFNKCFGFI